MNIHYVVFHYFLVIRCLIVTEVFQTANIDQVHTWQVLIKQLESIARQNFFQFSPFVFGFLPRYV